MSKKQRRSRYQQQNLETLSPRSRKTAIEIYPKSQTQALYLEYLNDRKKDIIIATGPAGTGKAQPLSAKIKIPGGWTTMNDIKIGDNITTPVGKPAKVIGLYPQGKKETFIIEFKDGRKTECCGEHLWEVFYEDYWKNPKIISTYEIIEFHKKHKKHLQIKLPEHEKINDINLPIDPYLLGCLLGDGGLSSYPEIRFSSSDKEIITELNNICKNDGIFEYINNKNKYDYSYKSLIKEKKQGVYGVFETELKNKINELKLFGVKSDTKFIPEIYFNSSKEQKIKLIQGLLDTDGYASKNNELIYTTVSKKLCDSMVYLIRSIGGQAKIKTKITSYKYKGKKKHGMKSFNISIIYHSKKDLVTLKRKQNRLKNNCQYSKNKRISIKSIIPSGIKECQCIMIDNPNHLYITDNFIVTHNTHVAVLYALKSFKSGDCTKIILTRPAVSVDEKHGHLPGTLIEKMAPWTRPITDIFEEFYSPRDVNRLIEENIFEIAPLAYMRGRTFKNSIIILDEAQNATIEQTKMLLTRIGEESRIFINGDLEQYDRGYEKNGLNDFVNRLENNPSLLDGAFGLVKFSSSDSIRHNIIEEILNLYKF